MNIEPRPWQTDFTRTALAYFDQQRSRNFLAAVCPGAGKTIGAYLLIKDLLGRGDIRHAIIVGHTDRIRSQWIETARQVELRAMTDIPTSNRNWPRDIPVLVMTYQQVVNRAEAVARLATEDVPTLVVFDEIHHAGDENTWGTRLKAAFRSARKRLLLTGTAFRNDGQAIPYVRYDPRSQRVQPDFSLDYATALRHGYVAPLYFHTYDAEGRWTKGDDEFEASFGDRLSQEQASYLLNTAITRPAFVKKIVGDAHERLNALRQAGHADAGGLIVTRDQAHARDVAGRPTPGTPPGRDGRGGFSIQPICERKGIMQIPLPNTVILSREAAAVLKRARAAWAAPTEDAGVWAIVADTEAEAADALAAAGLIVEEYSFVRGRMMAAITGAGMVALLVYEEQERAQQNGGAR